MSSAASFRPKPATRLPLALTLLGLLACAEDFAPYNRILGLRVLAIRSEPVSPAPGMTTTLTPLVVAPAGVELVFSWSWCPLPGPAQANYPCLIDEATLREQIARAGADPELLPPYDLGNAHEITFTHHLPTTLFANLCASPGPDLSPLVRCDDGFPIQIRMRVRTRDGTEAVDTVRTLTLALNEAHATNTNPEIGPLFVRRRATDTTPELVLSLDGPKPRTLVRLRSNTLIASVDESQSQAYMGHDAMGTPILLRERLFLSWFIDAGDTRRELTTLIPGETDLASFQENVWIPPSTRDHPPDTARLFVVLRDHRGGVAWKTISVTLEAPTERLR